MTHRWIQFNAVIVSSPSAKPAIAAGEVGIRHNGPNDGPPSTAGYVYILDWIKIARLSHNHFPRDPETKGHGVTKHCDHGRGDNCGALTTCHLVTSMHVL
jgi:hypothetical protein